MVIPYNIIAINSTINIIVIFIIITDLYVFYARIYYFLTGLSQASFHSWFKMKLGYPFNLDTLVILEPEGVCNKEPTISWPFREETNFV